MKRRGCSCLAIKRTCIVLPGVVVAAAMLAGMIVHMESAFMYFRMEPVFSFYPQSESEQKTIFFPHLVHGTNLVVERMVAYDGLFLEDGSNDVVADIAALVLHNRGTQPLLHAKVELQQGERNLVFYAETLLPGDTVLVPEAGRQKYEQAPCKSCDGEVVVDESILLRSDTIQITTLDPNCLLITNKSEKTLEDIRLEYKYWQDEPGLYIGGVTCVSIVGDILPGDSKSVVLNQNEECESRVIRVTCK